MANNKSDLRQEILTNELGNQMLNMVAPIYDNSKVTLYLFQAIGITLESIRDFFSFSFSNLPPDERMVCELKIEKKSPNEIGMQSEQLQINGSIYRLFVIDNNSHKILCDETIRIEELTKDTTHYLDCEYSVSYEYGKIGINNSLYLSIDVSKGPVGSITLKLYEVDEAPSMDELQTGRLVLDHNFVSQIFLQTATWGLDYWEDEYGIIPDPSWDYEQRRQNLLATLRYTAPITPKKIADRISSLLSVPVTVNEKSGNAFEIVLHKLVLDHTKLYKTADRITPAHLIYNVRTEEEENSGLKNYYKITTTETESASVNMRYTVLVDENDNILTNELDEVLTV